MQNDETPDTPAPQPEDTPPDQDFKRNDDSTEPVSEDPDNGDEADPDSSSQDDPTPVRTIISRHPNHTWHIDFTVVPTLFSGMYAPWIPFALVQQWPFCWRVAVVTDHFSR